MFTLIKPVRLKIYLSPAVVLLGLAASLFLALAEEPGTETITLATYYPAPSGVYNKLITTGDTYLDRDQAGNVGIGTTAPQALLDVDGLLRLWNYDSDSDPPGGVPGDVYYNASSDTFRGYYAGGWQDFGSCRAVAVSSLTFTYCDPNTTACPPPPGGAVMTGPGVYSWTPPRGTKQIWVSLAGGGGGGGNYCVPSYCGTGGGGGGGGASVIATRISNPTTATIAAGAPGAPRSGGGTSSYVDRQNSLSAAGGAGGQCNAAGASGGGSSGATCGNSTPAGTFAAGAGGGAGGMNYTYFGNGTNCGCVSGGGNGGSVGMIPGGQGAPGYAGGGGGGASAFGPGGDHDASPASGYGGGGGGGSGGPGSGGAGGAVIIYFSNPGP